MQVGPFDFEGLEVRVITDELGNPWFVAADVCGALDIGNSSDAISRLDDDELGVATTEGNAGKRNVRIVN